MQENSEQFEEAVELLNFKVYEQAIRLFQQDLEENPQNLASFHNIGLAQTYLGVDQKSVALLRAAIDNLEKAVSIAKDKKYESGYPFAEANLKWAKEKLAKLT